MAVITLVAAGGCGDDEDLPAGIVAEVRGEAISVTALDRMMVGRLAISHSADWRTFWPADVDGCVKAKKDRRSLGELSEDELRDRCEQERDRERRASLKRLIQGRWYELEARRRGIPIPTTRAGARNAAPHSGVRPEQLVDAIRINTLRSQLALTAASIPASFPPAEIASYYRSHRKRYFAPEQRLVEGLIVRTREQAQRMARLLGRSSARKLAKRYGNHGVKVAFPDHLLTTIAIENRRVGRAAKRLRPRDVGIVRDPGGWFVFRLAVVVPAYQQSLKAAGVQVTQDLQARSVREAYEAYNAKLRSKYADDTVCADGYEVDDCG